MGAWGEGAFENDTACDWAYQHEECDGLSVIEAAIDAVFDAGSDYLDEEASSNALAACEVVARLKGNFGVRNSYTETVDKWV